MKKILDIITAKMQAAFEAAGYDASFGRVNVSNRPDLCEYQCNGALAAANSVTAPIIEEATLKAQEQARLELLPEAERFKHMLGYEVEHVSDIYVAENGVGAVVTAKAKGYGGDMTVMVAFTADGTIKRIKVTEQAETKVNPETDSRTESKRYRKFKNIFNKIKRMKLIVTC